MSKIILDNPDSDYDLIETMANLLGSMGYSLLRISYLKFLRRLAGKRKTLINDSFVTASTHLGHGYLRLGKSNRAGLIFAQASARIALVAESTTVSTPAQILYLSRYAEYLALLGNHDRRRVPVIDFEMSRADLIIFLPSVLKLTTMRPF